MGEVAGMPVEPRGALDAVGPAEGESPGVRGRLVPGAAWGFARRLPRWGAPARTALPPGPRPRSGLHGESAATTARAGEARTASGREHQGDKDKNRRSPLGRG